MMISPDWPRAASTTSTVLQVGFVDAIGRASFSDALLRAMPALEPAYRSGSRGSLLASLAAGRLDLAVYPGVAAEMAATALLCGDRFVTAMRSGHPLARATAVRVGHLLRETVLLLSAAEDGELRRLACATIPGLVHPGERSLPGLLAALHDGDQLALVPERQANELGSGVAIRPLADVDARFPIHFSWSPSASAVAAGLIAVLAE